MPAEPHSDRTPTAEPGTRSRSRKLTPRTIGLYLIVGALGVLFAIIAVLVGLQAPRLSFMQWLLSLAFLLPIAGAIVAILWYSRGLSRETRERMRAQEEIARSEAKFRGLFESAVDGIFFLDGRGAILDVNPAAEALIGRPRAGLVGTLITDVLRSDILPFADPTGRMSGEAGRSHLHQGVLTTSDGHERDVQLSSQFVRPQGGEPQLVLIARDVTEESDLQRRLLESERWASMGRLASFVAHEINTPLTNISLLTASIARRVQDADVQTRLGKISAQGKIAANITAELLKFGKPGSMNPIEIDLRDVIRGAVEQCDVYRRPGVQSRVTLGNRPAACRADPTRIQEVFVNLLKNAYEATERGEVRVRLEPDDEFFAVFVSDTGSGMPLDVQNRIFEPFFTTKKKGEGTGLGLALSRNFVTAHGGDIFVSSEVGKGSTFTVRLPRNLEVPRVAESPAPGGPPG